MTLKFVGVLEVVEILVRAQFHQAKFSCSRVIAFTEKEKKLSNNAETILQSLPRASNDKFCRVR